MLRRNFLKAAISVLGTGLVAVLPKPPVPAKRVEGFYGWSEMGGAVVDGDPITRHLVGCDWVITPKKPLEPEPKTYQFSDPQFIGKLYHRDEESFYIPRAPFQLELDYAAPIPEIEIVEPTGPVGIPGPEGPIGPPGIPDVGIAVGPDELLTDHGRIRVENNTGKDWQPGELVYLHSRNSCEPQVNRNGDAFDREKVLLHGGRAVGKTTRFLRDLA